MRFRHITVVGATLALAEATYWNSTVGGIKYGTAGVSASCSASASTVYIPFTETLTSIGAAAISQTSSSSTLSRTISTFTTTISRTTTVTVNEVPPVPPVVSTATATVTATVSLFTTVTASLPPISPAAVTSSDGPAYSFYVTSEKTVWQSGISPPSGVSLSIITTSIVVIPMPATSASTSRDSTQHTPASSASKTNPLTTFTPPAYSSTIISVLSPALTRTVASTHYITRTLLAVTPPASSPRASFTGINSAGWNASSTETAASSNAITSVSSRFIKFTRMVYFGHDDVTTSTSTQLVTATIGNVAAQTASPQPSTSGPFVSSSVTASSEQSLAVTLALGTSPFSYSTSIAFPTAPASSGPAASLVTQVETRSVNGTTVASSQAGGAALTSDGIHQTIGAATTSALTVQPLSTASSAYGLPASSSVSEGYAAATASSKSSSALVYTITTFQSGSGTTITVSTTYSQSTPRSTDGTTFNIPSTISTPASANSTSPRGSAATTRVVSVESIIGTRSTTISGRTTSALVATTEASAETVDTGPSGRTAQSSVVLVSVPLSNTGPSFPSSRASKAAPITISAASFATTGSPQTADQDTVASSSSLTGTLSDSVTTSSSISAGTFSSPTSGTPSTRGPATSGSTTFSTSTRSSMPSSSPRDSTSSLAVTPSASSISATSATISPLPSCGEQGDFTMNFDELPTFHSGSARLHKRQSLSWNGTSTDGSNGTSDVTQQPPLSLKPYKHMLFSGGYVYAPQPVEPFAPASAPNVAVFLANGTGLKAGPPPPIQNGLEPGEIADGPYHEGNPAFFFDAHSAALGCDSQTAPCTMEVTGYTWNNTVKDDVQTYAENYTLPACENYRNCGLTTVNFPQTFRNLSGIRMRAVRGSEPRTFFADDIKLRWADDSCGAGKTRQRSQ